MITRNRTIHHTHACAVTGCKARVDCVTVAIVDDVEDGIVSGHLQCDEGPQIDWLCDDHEDATPCAYCGEWDHEEADCDEAAAIGMSKDDHDEHEADAAYAVAKDGR